MSDDKRRCTCGITETGTGTPVRYTDGDCPFHGYDAAEYLAPRLDSLWVDEGCSWRAFYNAGDFPWTVLLEWHTDQDPPHKADWVTYRWQFDGETVEKALEEAVEWCERLVLTASFRDSPHRHQQQGEGR